MEQDHYAPPQASLEVQPTASIGLLIPFEDKAAYPAFAFRIVETFRWILLDRSKAGAAMRGADALGLPLFFLCIVAYLPTVLPGLVEVFFPQTPFWAAWMHVPKATPAQGLVLWFSVVGILVFAPVGLLLGTLLGGLMYHLGLWMVRGTGHKFGLLATLRTVAYTAGVLAWIILPFNLAKALPGIAGQVFLVVSFALVLFVSTSYHGMMLARTHLVETWRGVVGAWALNVIILGCLGSCLGLLYWSAGDAIREAFKQVGGA